MALPQNLRPRTLRRLGARSLPSAALAGALALTACGTSSPDPEPVLTYTPLATPTSVEIAPELLTPLVGLGPCQEVTDPGLDTQVPGLPLPDEAFLLEVTEQNGLVNVRGYAHLTPILFQLTYRERQDLEMVSVENEIQESETLYSDGEHRVFLKAAAVCELGSVFIAAIASEVEADAVPRPSRADG